jgi:hypothetical protein
MSAYPLPAIKIFLAIETLSYRLKTVQTQSSNKCIFTSSYVIVNPLISRDLAAFNLSYLET